jgi:hypothetical protein
VPPPGTILPFSSSTSGGGITWGRWASIYTDATFFDYATGGAVCDNSYVEKFVPGVANPIPDVLGSEIPSFIADTKYINSSTGTNTVFGKNRLADNTVYAIWIGMIVPSVCCSYTDFLIKARTIWALEPFSPIARSQEQLSRIILIASSNPLMLCMPLVAETLCS